MSEKMQVIGMQKKWQYIYYIIFAISCIVLITTYLSNTIIHYTSDRQFPINSLIEYPLSLLILPAELFALFFALYFIYTLFNNNHQKEKPQPLPNKEKIDIAILLPVYNEPPHIIERTIEAVKKMRWPAKKYIYLLDDSTEEEHIEANRELAQKHSLRLPGEKKTANEEGMLIRRKGRIGYKAGNINNTIKKHVKEEYFAIFDADQAPVTEFLEELMDQFSDEKVGFTQAPQYYLNEDTPLERTTKLGNNIFFHAQLISKAKDGALPFCGTNVIVRTEAFRKVNGFRYYTATEDIDLGIRLNAAGYKGDYIPKILVYGYGPQDIISYKSQQYRWANGNLATLRENWKKVFFKKGFSLRYQLHMLFTLGWWMIGVVSLIFVVTPAISLVTGWPTHHTWLPEAFIALIFINLVMGVGMISVSLKNRVTQDKVTIKDAYMQYSLITNSMFLFIRAAFNVARKKYIGFITTKKTKSDTGIREIRGNLLVSAACLGLSIYALYHTMTGTGLTNLRTYLPVSLWLLFYSVLFASSILFVEKSPTPTTQPTRTPQASTN